MFYNRGEVLSDQFDHFKFCFEGGGPRLGKNSHIFPVFLGDVPKARRQMREETYVTGHLKQMHGKERLSPFLVQLPATLHWSHS